MGNRCKVVLPDKPKTDGAKKLSGPQRLLCHVIDLMESKGCGWTVDCLDTANFVAKSLRDTLWYIDHAHKKLSDSACHVPKIFDKFQGYNEFKKIHHRPPIITSQRLNELSVDLSKSLSFPSILSSRNKKFSDDIEQLLECITKYKTRLDKDNIQHKESYQSGDTPRRSLESDTSLKYIPPTTESRESYGTLQSDLNKIDDYRFVDLDKYAPEDRVKRRMFIKNLEIEVPIMLYRMAYGGSIGTLNFIWKVPEEQSSYRETRNVKIVNKINATLPKFSTRSMRRDFLNRYCKLVKSPRSVLRNIFFELTGCEAVSETKEQAEVDERVTELLLNSDDSNLLLDYRTLNGKDIDTKFGTFFEEMGKFFDEQILQVNERRRGQELYLPMAISLEDLRNQIVKRLPNDTPIPCTETIRLQFQPNSAFQKSALKYSCRFNVKFRVQTRQARVSHPDARYVATSLKYLKEFCVKNRKYSTFVCLDDKAIVPVGEPGVPISTGVRGHNKVLAPADGPKLVATDHDFHLGGLVPSVAFVSDIPKNSNDSFFNGHIYVTTKDKVFQASTPYRHATELTRILRENYSDDDVNLETPILCLMTDGGPDHRVTFGTVQLSLIQLFIALDLDMLIALRTAPNHSWMNPAERCMSILNLSLQHCALSRKEMPETFEKAVKHKSTLTAVRNLAFIKTGFREAYDESIKSVIDIVNSRFERMRFKDDYLTTYKGVTENQIMDALEVVCQVLNKELKVDMSSGELRKVKQVQDFIARHGRSSHYAFQLKKCNDCPYCEINPPRIPEDKFQDLHFLPNPVPGENNQYKSFSELYGQNTGEEQHRPGAAHKAEENENDKQRRDLFKNNKVREVILCSECSKPRCIFSEKKLSREQDELILRLKEDSFYTCGGALVQDDSETVDIVVREALACNSPIETTYYSASLKHYLPPVCVHCGTAEDLLDDNNPYISALYEQYSVVRPLCEVCRNSGKDTKTWGKKFVGKKAKH
ncbi:uncharacterized protein LOC134715936 [Mytilus trossulus]|uniref:uncharacterized protein LOC134715924 n=1 Tax=Mytilus trossulus TaxID=6551 RepID=UPI0030053528